MAWRDRWHNWREARAEAKEEREAARAGPESAGTGPAAFLRARFRAAGYASGTSRQNALSASGPLSAEKKKGSCQTRSTRFQRVQSVGTNPIDDAKPERVQRRASIWERPAARNGACGGSVKTDSRRHSDAPNSCCAGISRSQAVIDRVARTASRLLPRCRAVGWRDRHSRARRCRRAHGNRSAEERERIQAAAPAHCSMPAMGRRPCAKTSCAKKRGCWWRSAASSMCAARWCRSIPGRW